MLDDIMAVSSASAGAFTAGGKIVAAVGFNTGAMASFVGMTMGAEELNATDACMIPA